jgi:hypothetical protein
MGAKPPQPRHHADRGRARHLRRLEVKIERLFSGFALPASIHFQAL